MYLYHGTSHKFENIDLSMARDYKDFGRGFYLTTNLEQATKWSQKGKIKEAYVYMYMVKNLEYDKYNILELLEYNLEWLDFITKNRMNGGISNYDIIYNRLADNTYQNLSESIRKYYRNEVSAAEVLNKIKFKDTAKDQFCFSSKKAISLLHRESTIIMKKNLDGKWISWKE